MNPYNFVPFHNGITRSKMTNYHDKIKASSISGYMECELLLKTKACIKSLWTENADPIYIPGSSIRGMIRTVCDVIGGGCGNKIEKNYDNIKDCYFPNHNSDFEDCSKKIKDKLDNCKTDEEKADKIKQGFEVCPICSLFGFSADKVVFASRICIHDTEPLKNKNISKTSLDIRQLMSPHPHRRSFYFRSYNSTSPTKGGEYLGRKFYLHADPKNVFAHTGNDDTITMVNEGAKFYFRVDFENLTECELNMLMFALALEDNWHHKLGYGKPLGLGSVKISISSLHERNHDYYRDFSQCEFINKTSDIQRYIDRFNDQLKSKNFYEELKNLMEYNDNWLEYPGYWLTENPDGTIECYNKSDEAKKAEDNLKKKADEQIKKMKKLSKTKQKIPPPEPPKSSLYKDKLPITRIDDVNLFVEVNGVEVQVTGGSTYGLNVGQKIIVEIRKLGDKITNVTSKGKPQ